MNEHESIKELLALSAAGVLSSRDQSRVDVHARSCEACLRELEAWKTYADGLRRLPQPTVPAHLLERTQARLAQQQIQMAEHRSDGLVLVVLSLFGWSLSFAIWLALRLATGGALVVLQTNILRPDLWTFVWTLAVWASGATAAVMLARRQREWRRVL